MPLSGGSRAPPPRPGDRRRARPARRGSPASRPARRRRSRARRYPRRSSGAPAGTGTVGAMSAEPIRPQSPAVEQPSERIADDLIALAVPITAEAVVGSTMAYLLRDADGGLHIVDPGWDSAANRSVVAQALAALGGPLRQVLVTHLHPDHLGLAAFLRDTTGAAVVLHDAEQEDVLAELATDPLDPVAVEARIEAWGVPPERRLELRRLDPSVQAADPPAPADVVVRHG